MAVRAEKWLCSDPVVRAEIIELHARTLKRFDPGAISSQGCRLARVPILQNRTYRPFLFLFLELSCT